MMFKLILIGAVMTLCYSKSVDNRTRVKFPVEASIKILNVVNNCLLEYKLDNKVIDEIGNGGYRNDLPYRDFIYCSYIKSGFADKDGNVKIAESAALFPAECNIEPVIKKCDDESGTQDPGKKVFDFFKCFQTTSPCLMKLL